MVAGTKGKLLLLGMLFLVAGLVRLPGLGNPPTDIHHV